MNTTKKRDANFELLRIIAMLMVVVLHFLSHSGALLTLGVPASSVGITATFIESFCIVAVNVWVLISGYFLSKSGFKIKRIIQVILEIFFYTLGITLVMQLVNVYHVKSSDTIYRNVQYFFPISSEHYWFATSYVLMYVFSPIMNKAVEFLSRKQLKVTIIGLLLWFSIIKSVIPVNFPTDNFGYGLDWFLTLYLIAAYIRKYDVQIVLGKKRSLMLYVLSCFAIFVMTVGLHRINLSSGRFNYYFTVTSHYNFILCVTGALGIFSFFRYTRIREGAFAGIVRFVAPLTFGVYLLHEHLEIRDRWILWMQGIFGKISMTNPVLFVIHLILSVLVIFVAGILIDWIRSIIFAFISRNMQNTKLFKALDKLDGELRDLLYK